MIQTGTEASSQLHQRKPWVLTISVRNEALKEYFNIEHMFMFTYLFINATKMCLKSTYRLHATCSSYLINIIIRLSIIIFRSKNIWDNIVPSDIKLFICHLIKWQIHPFVFKGTINRISWVHFRD